MTNTDLERAQTLITSIPDYPQPGVNFRDISPLIADGPALRAVTEALIAPFEGQFDIVGGLEARGFLFAGTIAAMTGVGILPIRKAGKTPPPGRCRVVLTRIWDGNHRGPRCAQRGRARPPRR